MISDKWREVAIDLRVEEILQIKWYLRYSSTACLIEVTFIEFLLYITHCQLSLIRLLLSYPIEHIIILRVTKTFWLNFAATEFFLNTRDDFQGFLLCYSRSAGDSFILKSTSVNGLIQLLQVWFNRIKPLVASSLIKIKEVCLSLLFQFIHFL